MLEQNSWDFPVSAHSSRGPEEAGRCAMRWVRCENFIVALFSVMHRFTTKFTVQLESQMFAYKHHQQSKNHEKCPASHANYANCCELLIAGLLALELHCSASLIVAYSLFVAPVHLPGSVAFFTVAPIPGTIVGTASLCFAWVTLHIQSASINRSNEITA